MVSGDAHDDSEWKCDAHVTRDFPALRSRNPRALSRAASAHSAPHSHDTFKQVCLKLTPGTP